MSESCYHCGLPVPGNTEFAVTINGERRPMCCPGCQAVASAIAAAGLENFYQYRASLSAKPDNEVRQTYAVYDLPEVSADYIDIVPSEDGHPQLHRVCLLVNGITCAACAWLIEHHLASLPGVKTVLVNVSAQRATLCWDPSQVKLSDILAAFTAIGYRASPMGTQDAADMRQRENRRYLLKLGVAGLAMMQTGMLAIGLYAGAFQGISSGMETLLRWVSLLFATPVVFYSGATFLVNAWRSLRHFPATPLTMDVPVALALLLAYLASAWATLLGQGEIYFDAVAMFVFFLLIGRYLEMRVRHRNERLGEGAGGELPLAATKLNGAVSQLVPVKSLRRGDRIRVAAGAILPCDGKVIEGRSDVSEALLTGEQRPVCKQPGSEVCAGSVNGMSPLTVEVNAVGRQTRLSTILALVERAQSEKPGQPTMADRLAGYFVAGVLLIAAITAAFWWYHAPSQALWVVVAVLVVACPCALSLATPATLAAASGELRRQGFLVTRGHVIETLATVDTVVFDKTGTLTEGLMSVASVAPLGVSDSEKLLALAAALEADCKHPIAAAFANITVELPATDVCQYPAAGITGRIGGRRYAIGKPSFVGEQLGFTPPPAPDSQCTCLLLADEQQALGWILLRDQLRPTAAKAVAALLEQLSSKLSSSKLSSLKQSSSKQSSLKQSSSKQSSLKQSSLKQQSLKQQSLKQQSLKQESSEQSSKQLSVRLLSGDRHEVVSSIAEALSIDDWRAAMTPQEKLEDIQALQRQGRRVLMVGDGINDIPVLSGADVSVAIGDATDLTRIHADSILLNGNLAALPEALAMAHRARRIIRQNLSWALLYNLTAMSFAVVGWVAPWAAAIGMSASSLLVVLNAMRLRRRPASSVSITFNSVPISVGGS